jgi:hypothetical protein
MAWGQDKFKLRDGNIEAANEISDKIFGEPEEVGPVREEAKKLLAGKTPTPAGLKALYGKSYAGLAKAGYDGTKGKELKFPSPLPSSAQRTEIIDGVASGVQDIKEAFLTGDAFTSNFNQYGAFPFSLWNQGWANLQEGVYGEDHRQKMYRDTASIQKAGQIFANVAQGVDELFVAIAPGGKNSDLAKGFEAGEWTPRADPTWGIPGFWNGDRKFVAGNNRAKSLSEMSPEELEIIEKSGILELQDAEHGFPQSFWNLGTGSTPNQKQLGLDGLGIVSPDFVVVANSEEMEKAKRAGVDPETIVNLEEQEQEQ